MGLRDLLNKFEENVSELEGIIEQKRKEITRRINDIEESDMFSSYDGDLIKAFFARPYVTLPRKAEEWYLIAPKFIDINVGYLTKSTDSFNVFIVNKYADYLGAVPSEFKQVFKFKPKLPIRLFDGMMLTGPENQSEAWDRYSKFLLRREGTDKIRVKAGKEFQLLASLIADGILPFIPKPVAKEHLIEGKWLQHIQEIDRRRGMDFFRRAFSRFTETGAVGIFWAMSVGKTIYGLEALSRIRVGDLPNLVVSGTSVALREQWIDRLKLIQPAAPVEVQAFQSWHKVKDKQWGLVIFDECHHLPAETFSKLATIHAEYRIGLSATPYREDGKTEYIFALTGFPVGLDWRVLLDLDLIREPAITLYLCSSYRQKEQKLGELLQDTEKTLIYCFSIDIGKSLSNTFGIPFVHGDTPVRDRLSIIKSSQVTIVSSVGKEGISIQDIERTISYNFLFGSRQEETQFFGRLLHGQGEGGQHVILMTDDEYENYGKRLYGIQEKGFKIRIERVDGGSVPSIPMRKAKARRSDPRPVTVAPEVQPTRPSEPQLDMTRVPLLDERDAFDDTMLKRVLGSQLAQDMRGLTIGDIKAVLDHFHIKYGKYMTLKDRVRRLYESKGISGHRDGTKRRYFVDGGRSE